jgi:hypothetical protein
MSYKFHTIVASDSRAKDFLHWRPPNEELYLTHNIICRGARIDRVGSSIHSCLRRIPVTDIVVVRICAGINELTYKSHHDGGVEITLQPYQNLLQHILQLKESIRKAHPKSLVGIATIPPINFKIAQHHYIDKGLLSKPHQTEEDLKKSQEKLNATIAEINARIIIENKINQYIPELGTAIPTQLFLHQDILKTSIKKTGRRRRIRIHIQDTTLPDGIHPCERVSNKWFAKIHENFVKEIDRVKNAKPLNE